MIGFIAGMVACGFASLMIGNLCEECDELKKQITELNEQIERDRAELEKYL
jgi:molecular chaperone GrpE (heat shock protein)